MEIEDLKPTWQRLKVQNTLANAHLYNPYELLEQLESSVYKSTLQRIVGAGVMLVLIFMFCQGG